MSNNPQHKLVGKLFPMGDNKSTRTIKKIYYLEDYEGALAGFALQLREGSDTMIVLDAGQMDNLQYEQMTLSLLPCLDGETKKGFWARLFGKK